MCSRSRSCRLVLGALTMVLVRPSDADARQTRDVPRPADSTSVTIAAGTRYQANAIHRWLFGGTYRDLWVMPVRVPVLNLRTFAGGLHPTKEGGGLQTKSVRFKTTFGVEYVFRLSDKFVGGSPGRLKDTPADRIFQDQVSAMHPAGAEIAGPIMDASGVLHPTAMLVVMPDDSILGKFRREFAGRLGMIEEYPNVPDSGPAFGCATKIIDSDELLKLLNGDSRQHVDAMTFLTARLTDFLINDNDRHLGNWKWARLDSMPASDWEPIARDRDHAFVSYDGVLIALAGRMLPQVASFGAMPSVARMTVYKGFDERMLSGLEKPVWDSVARALQARITDSVIAAAAASMSIEYRATSSRFRMQLMKRRDALTALSDAFYRQLAARVDVHGTDAADRAVITRVSDGIVDVRLESRGTPYFARRFDGRETAEILVYLHDGDDIALVTGRVQQSILVRVIGGNGTNTLIDSSIVAGERHPTHVYEAGAVRRVSYGLDTLFDRRPWEMENGVLGPPHADHGTGYAPEAGIIFHRRTGATPHLGIVRYQYGFGHRPYASMTKLEGDYSRKHPGVEVALTADKRLELSPLHFTAYARMSDLEIVNFSGFGNATIDSGSASSYFEVHQRQWLLRPAIAFQVGPNIDLSLGPMFQHTVTDSVRSRFVANTRPYEYGTFNQAGVQLGAHYERRRMTSDAERIQHTVLADITGRYFPTAMDVVSPFEDVTVALGASLPLPLPTHPLFVARAGGKQLFGDFPYFAAANIGGERTMRYMDTQRYAGDGSLYASSELRIPVARFQFVVPLRVGILGLAEAGRVYDHGSSPGGWHTTTGEGFWIGLRGVSTVLTFVRTTERGHDGLHFRLGLGV